MRRTSLACALFALLSISARAADEGRLVNTFYLDGEKQTYVLTIREDRTFELLDPKGRKDSGRINATKREIGFMGGANRHFAYGFDGSDLLLMPTDKDGFALGTPLGEMPPRRENETLKFLSRENWLKAHPELVQPAGVAAASATGAGAGGGSGYESLLEIERSRGKTAAQNEAEYRLYMAAGDREYFSGRLPEAQKQYEYAQRFKANDPEAARRIAEIQRGGGLAATPATPNTGTPAGGWHGNASEVQVLDLVRQGKMDDAQRAAEALLEGRPNSLRLSRLKAGVEQVRAVDRTSAGV
ncbi:MAG: hypothetical protein KIS92_22915, partial [Planctomycetota bacterium]|nr:hypothetical protein [Planctomycetota bacterium]